jgi:cytoskeletal protein RodZ
MPSFGPILKRTREERRVSLDDVARETRLSKRYLGALEDEAIGKLPGGTYNRSYLRTYAAFLRLDPEPLLRLYAAEVERQASAAEQDVLATMNKAIDQRRHAPATAAQPGDREPAMALAGAIVGTLALLVVLGAGAFWYMRLPPDGILEAAAIDPPAASSTSTPAAASTAPVPSPPATESRTAAPATPAASRVLSPVERVERASHAPDALSHLSISGSGVGTAIVDRKLVGRADRFSVGSRVVFWTRVVGGRAGDAIDHVWFRDGKVVGAASLNVGSADWRTQSRRVVSPPGEWVVEARDADGRVLARHEFRTSDQ